MNSDPLDDLLGAYSKQSTPTPPDRFTTGVWQEIELRRNQSFWRRLLPALNWHELFREPRVALPAFALAVLIGLLPAATLRSYGEVRLARESLHFEVFSTNLPATALWAGPHNVRKTP
ncbi:MAG TPA: hypothetical protein VG838_06785 [Opitutaceae bacterium]|nr:hypothetical protein [Lacunisphaera sp.]HWA09136.1 hypothetical protein [Opitutaceae bacterium]